MKLFICGNGFDLHHNLPTGYGHYAEFLKAHYPRIFREYEDFPYLSSPYIPGKKYTPWTDIEKSLTIDYDELMSNAVAQDYPDVSSDTDSRWSDMEVNVGILTEFLEDFTGHCFYEWLSSVDCSNAIPDLSLPLDALYVSFNYTDTLQVLYNIPEGNVLHIHGALKNIDTKCINNASIRTEIQFGSPELDPDNVCSELEQQYGDDDFYGASISLAVTTLGNAAQNASKNISNNYTRLEIFLGNHNIDEVIILGHTLSEADFSYYADIIIPKYHNVQWTFMYHSNTDDIDSFLAKTGLENFRMHKW